MRDALLLLIICSGSLAALRRPWIGVMLWTWISLMNPHAEFGWRAATLPVASVVAGCTLIGLAFTRDRQNPFLSSPVWALLAFTAWVSATLPFSMYLDPSISLWTRSLKIFLMLFVTMSLVNSQEKLSWFIGTCVFSLAFYGVKGGVFTLATGGNFRVWGPAGFIEGNNELALALVMVLPLMRYLHLQIRRAWPRRAMALVMVLTAVTVLGTYSRGALLALSAMSAVLWIKSERKVLWGVLLVLCALVILSVMPEQWWARMDTIKTYERDDSALGRINAWIMAWNLARDHFFGGGFSIYYPEIFLRYSPEPDRVHAAHSIYFQVLGEHGFAGLFLFLLIGWLTWRKCVRLQALARANPNLRWAGELGSMIQVGMIGFAVGGAFLSLAYFDLPYDMMAMAVIALHLAERAGTRSATKPAAAATPEPSPGVHEGRA